MKTPIPSTLFMLVLATTSLLAAEPGTYNYQEALQKALFFYDAQRSGDLPDERGPLPGQNRVEWRDDSHLDDGWQLGRDLTGGWYDAGDSPKWNYTMANSASGLYWSGVDYREGYLRSQQMPYLKDHLKWVSDYFLKCWEYDNIDDVSTYSFVVQIDIGQEGSEGWGAYEVMHLQENAPERKIWTADPEAPNANVISRMAATLAGTAMVYMQNSNGEEDLAYADMLLATAQRWFEYSETYPDYSLRHPDGTIEESDFWYLGWDNDVADDLSWAAIWLHRALNERDPAFGDAYLQDAIEYEKEYRILNQWFRLASNLLLLQLVDGDTADYTKEIERILSNQLNVETSPGGLVKIMNQWGTLRHANNAAWPHFVYSDILRETEPERAQLHYDWAKRQLDYALGTNPHNRSYLGGFQPPGKSVVLDHHSASAAGTYGGFATADFKGPTRHIFFGHLNGGPDWEDNYLNAAVEEKGIHSWAQNECALNYMTGFVPNLAKMSIDFDGEPLASFPPKEVRDPSPSIRDDEFFVLAKVETQGSNFIQVRAELNNRSNLPARALDQMSFRYIFTLDGDTTIDQITVTTPLLPDTGVLEGPFAVDGKSRTYYIEVSYPEDWIFPMNNYFRRTCRFRINSQGTWDNSNDFSFQTLASQGENPNLNPNMPVYNEDVFLKGLDPTQMWAGYPFVPESKDVDTDGFLGWVNATYAPWIWVYSLDKYCYLDEAEASSDSGAWVFVPQTTPGP